LERAVGIGGPRGGWKAVIDRLYDGIAAVTEVVFEDGSRWKGLDVAILKE